MPMPPLSPSRRRTTLLSVVCAVVLVAHFLATVVFLMPLSIVGVRFGSAAHRYIVPVFQQRWSLFAPDPPLQNVFLHFQCKQSDGAVSPWFDRASVLQEEHASYRFTPEAYLFRIDRAAVMTAVGSKDQVFETVLEKVEESGDEALLQRMQESSEARERARLVQHRFVYALVAEHCRGAVGADVRSVRPRVVFQDIPKYSHRYDDPADEPATSVDFPWVAIESIPSLGAQGGATL